MTSSASHSIGDKYMFEVICSCECNLIHDSLPSFLLSVLAKVFLLLLVHIDVFVTHNPTTWLVSQFLIHSRESENTVSFAGRIMYTGTVYHSLKYAGQTSTLSHLPLLALGEVDLRRLKSSFRACSCTAASGSTRIPRRPCRSPSAPSPRPSACPGLPIQLSSALIVT